MRLKDIKDEVLALGNKLSFTQIADYIMEKYNVLIAENTLKYFFRNNGVKKEHIYVPCGSQCHGERKEIQSSSGAHNCSNKRVNVLASAYRGSR